MTAAAPVVTVSGMLCDTALWDDVRAAFGPRVSDVVPTAPSIGGMAEEVLAASDEPFVLVGLSLGAIVGFEVLRRAPERVTAFAAMSTNAGAPTKAQRAGWATFDAQTRRGGFSDVVRDSILPTMFAAPEPPAQHAGRFTEMAERVGPEAFRRQLAAQATRTDATASLAEVDVPTLVLCGTADALCPPEFHRRIAGAVPGAELHTVQGAGHLLPVERPAEVADHLTDWLTRCRIPKGNPCPNS
ncbi:MULTISPECIES: alpha/beta fold hydrolase [Prauserella salsuginis group]|uniref:Pimeloyl-ACP methyl ester carboxylesterase n=2 Tax=Prauserella salsuginis group TaxID=2893672 RepID=A0A839XUL2_9PSEU|nr:MULTISPECIES: alpha/beta fold hydrolase [Prauserella salsuginis group]MBB3664728.1 pimeloyl-ACP methyl ester carboxylesterase [Prauserella sediminis]MCR3722194.1 Pimeloyl-ACP methyl ester carboxylesterase [Prauserella flava]MCR3736192.1 Pimeloyl-ACP methyl ester carboxylesterase [Prauserella salsuginis]